MREKRARGGGQGEESEGEKGKGRRARGGGQGEEESMVGCRQRREGVELMP